MNVPFNVTSGPGERPERRRAPRADGGQPVRVHTLGRFGILIDGAALTARQTRQQKPVELLQCAIAFGGRGVGKDALCAALWPDADGDDAVNAYDVTLHRLRKLLKHEDALIATGNRLTINNERVWVDVWTFEKLLNRIDHATSSVGILEDEALSLLFQALSLYQGGFLARDPHKPWALSMHERLRSKLIRCIAQTARRSEAAGYWSSAAKCYLVGIEMDPLYELFYQRLMICYREADRRPEALSVYLRCRANLASGLRVMPSLETEKIHATL